MLFRSEVINRIGYTKGEYMFDGNSCNVFSAIHEQSPDIHRGVVREDPMDQGAGDQGMMFGYATNETENYMPLPLDLAHHLMRTLTAIRKEGKIMTYLRPDAKSQVTIEYDDRGKPVRIDTIVISTQHDEFILPKIERKYAEGHATISILLSFRFSLFSDIDNYLLFAFLRYFRQQNYIFLQHLHLFFSVNAIYAEYGMYMRNTASFKNEPYSRLRRAKNIFRDWFMNPYNFLVIASIIVLLFFVVVPLLEMVLQRIGRASCRERV